MSRLILFLPRSRGRGKAAGTGGSGVIQAGRGVGAGVGDTGTARGEGRCSGVEVGGERDDVADEGCSREDGNLGAELGVRAGVGGVGAEHVVNDVKHAVGEKDVLLQDARRVDEDRVGRKAESDDPALPGWQRGPIQESVTVLDAMSAVDDVVVKHLRQLRHGHAREGGAEFLEGVVVRREDGDVLMRVDVRIQRGIRDCTPYRGEVEGSARIREVGGGDEERVDGVDDATFKLNVLGFTNAGG